MIQISILAWTNTIRTSTRATLEAQAVLTCLDVFIPQTMQKRCAECTRKSARGAGECVSGVDLSRGTPSEEGICSDEDDAERVRAPATSRCKRRMLRAEVMRMVQMLPNAVRAKSARERLAAAASQSADPNPTRMHWRRSAGPTPCFGAFRSNAAPTLFAAFLRRLLFATRAASKQSTRPIQNPLKPPLAARNALCASDVVARRNVSQ